MKKYCLTILLVINTLILASQEKTITVIHTNDMHSRLNGFAPESAYTPLSVNDDATIGGFARLASIIAAEKSRVGGSVLVIDAGDFLMGTLFHTAEAETGFQLGLMKKMGYDIVALGNHEFDFGPATLAEIVSASLGSSPIPDLLLGNVVFSPSDSSDNALEQLYKKNIIRPMLVRETGGLKVGIFSLLGKDASVVAPKAKPLIFSDQVSFATESVRKLKSLGCDLIICVSHSGVTGGKDDNWTGEDIELAQKVSGINLIISGHTHSLMKKPMIVNGIPVIQSGEYAEYAGVIRLKGDKGNFRMENYELVPVNDKIAGDPAIDELIKKQEKLIGSRVLEPAGLTVGTPVVESSDTIECNEKGDLENSNLGPLVADAIHYYLNSHSDGGDDVSMVSAGVIRDNIVPGIQRPADIFRIVPLGSGNDNIPGYPLSRLYVTGRELKNVIEVLLVAKKSNPDYHCFFSGLRIEYDPDKGLCKKISRIDLLKPDGTSTVVDLSKKNKKLYSVAANSYMLQFIGIIKKKTHGLVNVVPKDITGNRVTDFTKTVVDTDASKPGIQEGKEWLAMVEYLMNMKDLNGNGIPDLDKTYSKPVPVFKVVRR